MFKTLSQIRLMFFGLLSVKKIAKLLQSQSNLPDVNVNDAKVVHMIDEIKQIIMH